MVADGSAIEQQKNSGDFGLQVVDHLVNQTLGKSCSPAVVLTTGTLWGTNLPSPSLTGSPIECKYQGPSSKSES